MKRILACCLATAACVVVPSPAPLPPPPPAPVAVASFDEALGPDGQWIVIARVGRVWRPHAHVVGAAFVPYLTGGHWVLTEHGWFFESGWPWGWATFHYGRWHLDPLEGWVWVPGDVWGPAWVEWRSGGGYVGWVPLPPPGIDVRARWCFVETRNFTHRDVAHYRVHEASAGWYHAATPVPPSAADVWRETGTPVRTVTVGPPPPPGVAVPMRHAEDRPAPAPPPPTRMERPVTPPPPPGQRFEKPPDRRPDNVPPSAPPPPPARFVRPADRRPEPAQPFRLEPRPPQLMPAPALPPGQPQQPQQPPEDPKKKKKRLLSS